MNTFWSKSIKPEVMHLKSKRYTSCSRLLILTPWTCPCNSSQKLPFRETLIDLVLLNTFLVLYWSHSMFWKFWQNITSEIKLIIARWCQKWMPVKPLHNFLYKLHFQQLSTFTLQQTFGEIHFYSPEVEQIFFKGFHINRSLELRFIIQTLSTFYHLSSFEF